MTARHANELLYDTEAALRLVDSAIEDIREASPRASTDTSSESLHAGHLRDLLQAAGPLGLLGISQILARGHGEIISVLRSLRESRDVLARTSSDRVQATHAKLREVTNATESAASDILDGLDRAVALVDQMDAKASDRDAASSADLRGKLRDELFSLMGCMQFQDITTQQLNYASSVLTEIETRLAELASILGPAALGAASAPAPATQSGSVTFDPAASVENAENRQAVADQIFGRPRR
jgi:chemotaxis regulatin CheY-phosphate phosphatase CheZ